MSAGAIVTPLEAVSYAAIARADAEDAFREALKTARAEGHSLSEIAAAAGLTKAGVAYLLGKESE